MYRTKYFSLIGLIGLLAALLAAPAVAFAQAPQPAAPAAGQPLTIYTTYPSQVVGIGQSISLTMKLKSGTAQTVKLSVQNLPKDWKATFRGGGAIIDAVYLDGTNESDVDLRLETPADIKAAKYEMTVLADGGAQSAKMPLSFAVQEKLPPSLSLSIDGLPTQQGTPSSTFTFNVNLKNDGGEDLVVALAVDQPHNFQATVQSLGQAVTQVQVAANETKNLTVKAEPLISVPAGEYPIVVHARAGDVKSDLDLTAQVVGEGKLNVSSPDGRLSGQAEAGKSTTLKVELSNDGTASLKGIALTSNAPTGWSVTFDQPKIAEIAAGDRVDVTAAVKPADKAVAGDYMITISAQPLDSKSVSADYRITVTTSTLWGVAGIVLIAIAVGAVSLAVSRFGRR